MRPSVETSPYHTVQPRIGGLTMGDMLVKLYDIPDDWSFLQALQAKGVTIRKPFGPEKHVVVNWVREHFSNAWASETEMALANRPITCFVAIKDGKVIGFACYDATALGFFGPIGVDETQRGLGIGRSLVKACMLDMKLKGYKYAIIGLTDKYSFYERAVEAVEIPDSYPGFWKDWLREN